jgi:hypothetical protein
MQIISRLLHVVIDVFSLHSDSTSQRLGLGLSAVEQNAVT